MPGIQTALDKYLMMNELIRSVNKYMHSSSRPKLEADFHIPH